MAPIARINVLTQYQGNPGFEGKTINLPIPKYIGKYYRFDLKREIIDIDLPGFSVIEDPTKAILRDLWINGSTINLYAGKTQSLPNPLTFDASLHLLVPPRINNVFTFLLPKGFIVSGAESECLSLGGLLTQKGNVVEIATHLLQASADIDFRGYQSLAMGEPQSAIATFDLSTTDLRTLYSVEFLGSSFTAAVATSHPLVGEFLWNETTGYLTIFLSSIQGQGL